MANTLITPTWVTREFLRVLHDNLSFIGNITRWYDDRFKVSGAKVGNSVDVRLPVKARSVTGPNLSIQDVTEQVVTVQLTTQRHIDFSFSTVELTTDVEDFRRRYIEPFAKQLASEIEADVLSNVYKDVYNAVGTPGTVPGSLSVFLEARRRLNEYLVPMADRSVLMNSETMVNMVDALKALFHDASSISEQYKEGFITRAAGFDWYENQLLPVHDNGGVAGTPLVNGANQTGSSLVTDGWTANTTIKKGTIFTISGVYAVHPETKNSYRFLQQFVVTSDVTADASGNATIPISPSITTSGAYQNVSGSPADNATITVLGSGNTLYPQNMAFHKEAFVFATADLELPQGVDWAARESYDGISVRIIRDYSISDDTIPCRIDVLYGYKCVRPEMAVRIYS